MPKLITIRGNSGSGKTSLATLLQHRFGYNTMVISQDAVRRGMLWVKDGEGTAALPLLIELLKYGHKNSEIVILEGILDRRWYKALFEEAKALYVDSVYPYYYDLSFEETVKRHQTRPQHSEFGEEDMRRWFNDHNRLTIFNEEIFTSEITLEQAADLVYNKVVGNNVNTL